MTKYLLSSLVALPFLIQAGLAWQLPLEEISDPACKSLHRQDHDESCKWDFTLPEETVVSGPGNTSQKLLFSVLYESSYQSNDGKTGGHPGIDIVSAKGTPAVAIHEGIVTKSQGINGYGNTVIIQHTDGEETIFSTYAHLDKILVKEGDVVQGGTIIGEIGNTGFTLGPLGNHLDFQIVTEASPIIPYSYSDCSAGYMSAVQNGFCKKELYEATHNPFEFLHDKLKEQAREVTTPIEGGTRAPVATKSKNNSSKIQLSTDLIESIRNTNKELSLETKIPDSSRKKIVPELDQLIESVSTPPTQAIIKKELPFSILASSSSEMIQVGRLGKLHFQLSDLEGKTLSGMLSKPVTLSSRNQNINLYFDEFQFVSKGKKQVLFQGKKKGMTKIDVRIDGEIVQTLDIMVQ